MNGDPHVEQPKAGAPTGSAGRSVGPAQASVAADAGPPLRMGVLGCADIAVRRILPVLADLESTELVAVASRDRTSARDVGKVFDCLGIGGYQALLDRDDIDAIYIPLPPALHHEWASKAMASGKHVLVEKPLTTSPAETADLTALALEHRVVLKENFIFLHHSQHAAMRTLIAERVGQLQVFSSAFAVPPLPPGSFRYSRALGGGALLDVGVYPLRVTQLFLGPDVEVVGACLRVDPQTGVDVAGSALLRTAEGVAAHLDFGFEHAYRCTYSLWGKQGRISVDRAFTPPEQHRPVVRIEQQDLITQTVLAADSQVRNAVAAFVDAAREGLPGIVDPAAIRQSQLVEQIRAVARTVRA